MFTLNAISPFLSGERALLVIPEDSMVEGHLQSPENARIAGEVRGNVVVAGNLTLVKTGEISGNASAQNAHIAGTIKGNLLCREKVILQDGASVWGNIQSASLDIRTGAKIRGKILKPGESLPENTNTQNDENPRSGEMEIKRGKDLDTTLSPALIQEPDPASWF